MVARNDFLETARNSREIDSEALVSMVKETAEFATGGENETFRIGLDDHYGVRACLCGQLAEPRRGAIPLRLFEMPKCEERRYGFRKDGHGAWHNPIC